MWDPDVATMVDWGMKLVMTESKEVVPVVVTVVVDGTAPVIVVVVGSEVPEGGEPPLPPVPVMRVEIGGLPVPTGGQ